MFFNVSLLHWWSNGVPESSWQFSIQKHGIRILCSFMHLACNEKLCPWEMHQRYAVFQWKTIPKDTQKIKPSFSVHLLLLIEQRCMDTVRFACRRPCKLEFFSSQEETSWEGPGKNPEILRSTLLTRALNPSQHAKCKLLSTWPATAGRPAKPTIQRAKSKNPKAANATDDEKNCL